MKTLKRLAFVILLFNSFLFAENPDIANIILLSDVIIEKSFKTSEGKTLIFESSSGDIRIYTSDKPEVRIKIYGDPDVIDRIDLIYSENQDGMKIKVKKITSFWGFFSRSFYIDYDLIIPKKYNVVINSSAGDVYLKNLTGNIKIKNSAGDLKIENINGNISATTSGGDIILKKIFGDVDVSTTGGDMKLEEIKGDVNCSTTGGDIKIKSQDGKVNAKTTGGDIVIDYSGSNKGIRANTVGGDVRLILDSNFEGYFYLSTLGGDINYDFQFTRIFEKRSSRLEGEINKSEPRVECKTTGGDIVISKRSK
jgi:DUF4097 and DUF4098 domain-containing protein YvlB